MDHSLPRLTVACVFLGASAALAGQAIAEESPGNRLVAQAARSVLAESSLSADLRYRLDAFGHELAGQGSYQQLGDGPEKLLRLDLKVQVAGQAASRQEICGPTFYYVRKESPAGGATLGRVNLRQVRQAIARAPASAAGNPADVWILLGGLPKLLQTLHDNFDFAPPRDDELQFTTEGGQGVQRLPVVVVQGRWKKDRLAALLATEKGASHDDPEQLPDAVELVIGSPTQQPPLFPYRITYRKQVQSKSAGQSGSDLQPMLLLELFNVHRSNLKPEDFNYQPSEREVLDLTQSYLQRLGLAKPR